MMSETPDFWTDDRTARLVQAWQVEERTAAEIAEELGTTRGAVLGKLDRLSLLQPAPRQPSAARQRYESIVAAFEQRGDHGCSWPLGSPGEKGFRFCGEERPYTDCSYCEIHASAAYVPRKRTTRITKSVRAPAAANANGVEELQHLVAA
jgi:hypothetical protein